MNSSLTAAFVIAQIFLVAGWYVAHYFNSQRDRANAKRDKVIDFRIEAYRSLERVMGRIPQTVTRDEMDAMEKAIADIQVFGNTDEVEGAIEFTRISNSGQYADARPLLVLLRNNLRKELGLSSDNKKPDEITHWRLLAVGPRPPQASPPRPPP